MWQWLWIEILVLVNIVFVMLLVAVATTVVVDISAKRLAVGATFFWGCYFKAKEEHLQALLKLGIPDERKSAFN